MGNEAKLIYESMLDEKVKRDKRHVEAWGRLVKKLAGTDNETFDQKVEEICEKGKGSALTGDEAARIEEILVDCHN